MLELFIDPKDLEGMADYVRDLDNLLSRELEDAMRRRIGPKLSADAKRILSARVYGVEIPFRKRLRGKLLAKARRQVGGGKKATPEDVLAKVKGKFGGGSSGQPFRRWERAGDLIGAEGYEVRTDGGDVELVLTNISGHARARNALGGPDPPNRAGRRAGEQSGLSPTKEVHWQQEAVAASRDWIRREILAAVGRAWEKRP